MREGLAWKFAAVLAAGAVLFGGGLMTGCKRDAQLSDQELQQIKQGPPKEMPAEAAAAMRKMGQGGPSPGTPPRPAGQPGPGGPAAIPKGPTGP